MSRLVTGSHEKPTLPAMVIGYKNTRRDTQVVNYCGRRQPQHRESPKLSYAQLCLFFVEPLILNKFIKYSKVPNITEQEKTTTNSDISPLLLKLPNCIDNNENRINGKRLTAGRLLGGLLPSFHCGL